MTIASQPGIPLVLVGFPQAHLEMHAIVEGVRGYVRTHALDWEVVAQPTVGKAGEGRSPPIPPTAGRPAVVIGQHPPRYHGLTSADVRWVQWVLEGHEMAGDLAVGFDADAIGRVAVEHLVANGARTLATRQPITECAFKQQGARLRAFVDHAARRGIQVQPLWPDRESDFRSHYRNFCRVMPKPIGVFCYHDRVAEWLVADLHGLGIGVPQEVMVLGGNGSAAAAVAQVPVSSVRLPFHALGTSAAKQAHAILSGGRAARRLVTVAPVAVDERRSTAAAPSSRDRIVRRALQRIDRGDQPIPSVTELAAFCRCSRQHLLQRFKRELGSTPEAWLKERAMRRAAALLADTDLGLEEIARRCGIAQRGNLCVRFKRRYGLTTGAYRGRMRGS